MNGAIIKNIGIKNFQINDKNNNGGLVVYNVNGGGTINNCYASEIIITNGIQDSFTGGLVGRNYDGTISNSYATNIQIIRIKRLIGPNSVSIIINSFKSNDVENNYTKCCGNNPATCNDCQLVDILHFLYIHYTWNFTNILQNLNGQLFQVFCRSQISDCFNSTNFCYINEKDVILMEHVKIVIVIWNHHHHQ